MSKRRKRAPAKDKAGCPMWMMTFGDCMSLLVTFFVMLIAFSTLEKEKLANLVGVLRGAFGSFDLRAAQGQIERQSFSDVEMETPAEIDHIVRGESESINFLSLEDMADAMPDFINEIRKHNAESISDRLLIRLLDEGLSIIVQTSTLFEEGGTRFTEDFHALWQGIAWLLLGRANELRVTAVTSLNTPVDRTVASTSWGLGVARADLVARQLEEYMRSPPNRYGIGVQTYTEEPGTNLNDHMEIMIMEQGHVIDLGTESAWPKGVWQ